VATRRAVVRLANGDALWASRLFLRDEKLVYVILANKKLHYPQGRSRIAYIGTTKNGGARVAASAAARAEEVLRLHGVTEIGVRIVTAKSRPPTRIWFKLEHALLWTFREKFGAVPRCNSPKRTKYEGDAFRYFSEGGLIRKLEDLS
jgi:hypothetical protein